MVYSRTTFKTPSETTNFALSKPCNSTPQNPSNYKHFKQRPYVCAGARVRYIYATLYIYPLLSPILFYKKGEE
jgi:hypothetical protein